MRGSDKITPSSWRPHQKPHTISGGLILVQPTFKMMLWLLHHNAFLISQIMEWPWWRCTTYCRCYADESMSSGRSQFPVVPNAIHIREIRQNETLFLLCIEPSVSIHLSSGWPTNLWSDTLIFDQSFSIFVVIVLSPMKPLMFLYPHVLYHMWHS